MFFGGNAVACRRAERQGPGADMARWRCASALGPRRLARSEQSTGLTTEQRRLVGLRLCLAGLSATEIALERDRRPAPAVTIDRSCPCQGILGVDPALQAGAPRSPAPQVQPSFGPAVDAKKGQYQPTMSTQLRGAQRMRGADHLVVVETAVVQADGAVGHYLYLCAGGERWAEHHGIEQVALKAQQRAHGAIVERARDWREKIQSAGGADLAEAAAGDLDGDFQRGWRRRPDVAAVDGGGDAGGSDAGRGRAVQGFFSGANCTGCCLM
mgnify:CR=1 FL=1